MGERSRGEEHESDDRGSDGWRVVKGGRRLYKGDVRAAPHRELELGKLDGYEVALEASVSILRRCGRASWLERLKRGEGERT